MFVRRLSITSRKLISSGSALRSLSGRLSLAGGEDGNRVESFYPRRNEEQKFARTLCRLSVLEQSTDQWNIPEPRHLPDVDRIRIDQDSADDRCPSIGDQNLCLGGLCRYRRYSVHRSCKVRLAVRDT